MAGPGDPPVGNAGSEETDPENRQIVHATSLVCFGRGVLILGDAGCGKSGLALQLMAHGAGLIADDRTILSVTDGQLIAAAPPAIKGMIEARGIGLLNAPDVGPHPLHLAIDLNRTEVERLPVLRRIRFLGHDLPLLHKVDNGSFPAAILHYLKAGMRDNDS